MRARGLRPGATSYNGFDEVPATGCCSPLPRFFRCLGLDLKGTVRVFLAVQALYGVLLAVLHALLLAPPLSEPRCDWLPSSATPWLELLDLQWSLCIRGNAVVGWERPAQAEHGESLRPYSGSSLSGAITGLVLGVATIALAACISCHKGDGDLRLLEKVWLGFTTLQVAGFCACNLGKVPSLCRGADAAIASSTAAARSAHGVPAIGLQPEALVHPVQYPQVSRDCFVLRIWLVEWTLLASVIGVLGLWACWSYTNLRLQDLASGADCGELGEYGGVEVDSQYSAD